MSLISPSDYKELVETKGEQAWKDKFDEKDPSLNDEELSEAKKALVSHNYPEIERSFYDPELKNGQKFCLHSFYPSSGATPDEDGIYGMLKCRGVFKTVEKAEEYSEDLIRNVDSKHVIHISKIGRPFPMCDDEKEYAKNTVRVDLQQKVTKELRKELKEKNDTEKREMMEMKEREKLLLEESKEDYEEPIYEQYTTAQTKRSQLIWTWKDLDAKRVEVEAALKSARDRLREIDAENPEFKDTFFEHYMNARKQANIKDEEIEQSFIRYMMNDIVLPFETN
jgi:hypothetical protein